MKILVSIKRVIDFNVRVQVKSDGTGVVTDGVKMGINPFDEIALEAALRIKEAGKATEVIATSIGAQPCQEQLRTALAMGADRAIHIESSENIQPLYAAKLLTAVVKKEDAGLVLLGKQAIDDDCNQTGQMLAGILNWPQATFASKIELNEKTARVTREVDAGLETIEVDLPAVMTSDLRLNEPRYIKLQNIMQAKRKPLDVLTPEALNVASPAALQYTNIAAPSARQRGVKLDDTQALFDALKAKGILK